MNKSPDAARERFVARAEDLGGSCQFEFCKSIHEMVRDRYDKRFFTRLAAALANYVFHFGLVVPDHSKDERLMSVFAIEKGICLSSFGDTFKTNATGVLILLAACSQVAIEKFKHHMEELANLGFVKAGVETPNIAHELPNQQDLVYMHVVVNEIKSRPVDRDYAIAQAIAVLISNALAAPAGHLRLAKAETFVMDELERNRFNTERANEIYQFAIDDAALAWIKEKKLGRAISRDFLRTGLAKKYAIELTEKFKTKGFYKPIEDQRPPRRFLRFLLGA